MSDTDECEATDDLIDWEVAWKILDKQSCDCGDGEWSLVCACRRALKAERGQAEAAKRIIAGVHGALADAGDVSVSCDLEADLAPAVRELVGQRDGAREGAKTRIVAADDGSDRRKPR